MEQAIFVYVDLAGVPIKVGQLWGHLRSGRESMSFEYDRNWLNHPQRFLLDPALQLAIGSFHTSPDKPLFGAIDDSAPDRWGRLSPAYDLNPTPTDIKPRILSTSIDLIDSSASLDLAVDVSHYFDLDSSHAKTICKEVGAVTALWREEAARFKIKKAEIDRMASAFEHEDLQKTIR